MPNREKKTPLSAIEAHPECGSIAVKVRFPNPGYLLRTNAIIRVEVRTQPEVPRLTLPFAALLEDREPPGVVVVEHLETKKNAEGEEEKVGTARRLQALLGVRDRHLQRVELLGLV